MRLWIIAVLVTGCVANGSVLVRDAYVYDGYLVLEKCHVSAKDDRLVVGRCYEEARMLPARSAVRAVAPVRAPAASEEIEVSAPDGSVAVPSQQAVPTPSPTQALQPSPPERAQPAPPARAGFSLVRAELLDCGSRHGASGVVELSLDIRGGRIHAARTDSSNRSFGTCVHDRLAGIELPDTQPNRTLTVPFALRQR